MKAIIGLGVMLVFALPAFAQQQTPADRIVSLKASLEKSQVVLRQYEWIETTVVSLNGEEKFRKQERCYYGADGKLQKVLLTQSAPEPTKRGLRGKIAEMKKEELTDYMQEAVSLVHRYVPLDPVRILSVKEAGNVGIQLTDPGTSARLTFSNYLKAGDSLALDMDMANNHLLATNVKSYLESDGPSGFRPMIRIQSGSENPGDAFVAVPYRDHWFWVEDRDHPSKGMFSFLLILMSLADVDPGKGMPIITIPAN